jgi:hypothetical protein
MISLSAMRPTGSMHMPLYHTGTVRLFNYLCTADFENAGY